MFNQGNNRPDKVASYFANWIAIEASGEEPEAAIRENLASAFTEFARGEWVCKGLLGSRKIGWKASGDYWGDEQPIELLLEPADVTVAFLYDMTAGGLGNLSPAELDAVLRAAKEWQAAMNELVAEGTKLLLEAKETEAKSTPA